MDLGWILFLAGAGLLLVEAVLPGFFAIVHGTILVIVGGVLIVAPDFLSNTTGVVLLAIVTLVVTTLTILFYRRLAPTQKPSTTSIDTLAGQKGEVVEDVVPGSIDGKVKLGQQIWSATADTRICSGEKIVVSRAEGVHLIVTKE